MKSFMVIALLAFTYVASAERNQDSIHSVVRGTNGEPHLVKLNSGAVEFIESDDTEKLADYEARVQAPAEKSLMLLEEEAFEPTIVPDDQITAIFKRMNPFMKRKSECSDRAHVWAWDELQHSGIKSQKAFLMLTDTYIKRNRYKWWFHVAPLYTTASGQKIVMDLQFLDHPVTFTEWKNNLVFSKRDCVTDFRFVDYNAGADQTQDCYVKFEPMYYYIPGEIGSRELGRPKTGWSASQVNMSRSRAFFKGSVQ